MFKRIMHKQLCDRGAIFLEYAMVLGVMVLAMSPILPGGPVYTYLKYEVLLRILLISLPIF
jgi:hypothetical protein